MSKFKSTLNEKERMSLGSVNFAHVEIPTTAYMNTVRPKIY